MNQASFSIRKSKLEAELKKKSRILGKLSDWNKNTVIELTITDGLLTLVIPGSRIELPCLTKSTAKATISFFYFKKIIQTWNDLKIECIIMDSTIKIGVTSFKAQSTFFESDRILRSINLPMNYSGYHLLQLDNRGFTAEEIDFNGLEFELYQAKKSLKASIRKTTELLQIYGVTAVEIEELLNNKIKM
jgi:hypothetical protein